MKKTAVRLAAFASRGNKSALKFPSTGSGRRQVMVRQFVKQGGVPDCIKLESCKNRPLLDVLNL